LPLLACGYRPVYANGANGARLHVQLERTLVPDAIASDEVVAGVRDELSKMGALQPGPGYPTVAVEVLRAQASAEGIAAPGDAPLARATDIAVTARAWIEPFSGAPPENDTGDLGVSEVIALDRAQGVLDPRASAFHEADALRAAARRLGRKLARQLLGEPTAGELETEAHQ
jgi:hypothetical protein